MAEESIRIAAVLVLVFMAAGLVLVSRLPDSVKALACAGLALRVIGAVARYRIYFDFYGGAGDSGVYYDWGLRYAEEFRSLDFSSLFDSAGWQGGSWYGTQFVRFLSGGVMTFLGTSLVAEYMVFSLLGFIGLVGFGVAFRRAFPDVRWTRYLFWIWLFPSIWFWTSIVGKEAVLMMGLGIAVMGFIGRRGRVNWILLGIGLFLLFAVRPQVTGVVIVSMLLAHWLCRGGGWTAGRVVQGAFLLTLGVVGLGVSMKSVGIEEFDVEGVQEYVEDDPARRTTGGTSVEAPSPSVQGIPVAAFNVLFRPLPWEATNVMVLLSSAEIWAFWGLVLVRRKNFWRALKSWRTNRLLALSILFTVLYSVGLGMMVVNLGIIARQRVLVFPFLFVLLEAAPRRRRVRPRGRMSYRQGPAMRRVPRHRGEALTPGTRWVERRWHR